MLLIRCSGDDIHQDPGIALIYQSGEDEFFCT